MGRHLKKLGFSSWFSLITLMWLATIIFVRADIQTPDGRSGTAGNFAPIANNPQVRAAAPPQGQPPPAPRPAGYAGEKECIDCHDAQAPSYLNSKHHRVADPRTPGAKL